MKGMTGYRLAEQQARRHEILSMYQGDDDGTGLLLTYRAPFQEAGLRNKCQRCEHWCDFILIHNNIRGGVLYISL
jgi:hypothetical protein